ncbi:MAG: hypothetical protein FWD54_02315 [Endomicrobia bacterium]|nr:hypothetical protein [Endomicrobiia bacterium]
MNFIKTFLAIFLFSAAFSIAAFADEIKKDTDFFKVLPYGDFYLHIPFQTIKVNRLDGVKEFFVKSTGLLHEINYDNYTQRTNVFNIPMNSYISSDSNGYNSVKISRDLNNDIYIAGNLGGGYDVIKKFTNNIEQWSASPSMTECVHQDGLIISKSNDFLYVIYNKYFIPVGAMKTIYKLNKKTGAYSIIYSTPTSALEVIARVRFTTDEDDNIYLLSATDSKKLVLQKLDSSGNQIFIKEFTGISGNYIIPAELFFLKNGTIFIRGRDGWLENGQWSTGGGNDIIALVDKNGSVISNFVISGISDLTAIPNFSCILAGADENNIYYIRSQYYSPSTDVRNKTDGGSQKMLVYNYQNQLVKTLFLPTKTADFDYAYFTLDYMGTEGDNAYPHIYPFVKDKKLYVPKVINSIWSAHAETVKWASYNIDIDNPLISLKYSENPNFIDKVSNPIYITQNNHNITFRAKYKNFRERAPVSNFPRVHIYANGVSITSSPFVMSAVNPGDIDYAKGVDYSVSVPMAFTSQTQYSYMLELTDGIDVFNSDTYVLPNYLPTKPIAISPNANGEKVGRANVPLEWFCVASSLTYTLQVAGPYDNPVSTYSWTTKYSGSSTTYALTNLEQGKYYYWKVSAANSAGITEESDVFFFRAFDMPVAPVRISPNDLVEIIGAANVRLEWFCPTPNVTYSLRIAGPYESTTSSHVWTEIYNGADRNYHTASLEHGKHYYWKVSASNSEGDIAESTIFYFSTANVGKKAFNAPNPFNPAKGQQTQFVFEMPESGTAQIAIYSEYGDKVWESETFYKPAGQGFSEITYNGRDNSGKMLYNGTYLAVITKKYNGKTSAEKCRILVIK